MTPRDVHQQAGLQARVKELENERDALAAAMPSEGADAALAYAVEKSRADRLQAEVERLQTISLCRCGDGFSLTDPGTCGNCLATYYAVPRTSGLRGEP